MKWFKRTPDQELADRLRKAATELEAAMKACKDAGLTTSVIARYPFSNNWDHLEGKKIEVTVQRINRKEV